MQEYAVYMSKAAKILRDSINGGTDDSAIKHDVEQVVQFQISLAKVKFIRSSNSIASS